MTTVINPGPSPLHFTNTKENVMSTLLGKTIRIVNMEGEPQYAGRTGTVTFIDDAGQLHGTWGGLAVIPGQDSFEEE